MDITQAPPATELVRRATELVPLLRRHAAWAEEHRRMHDEALEAIVDAGFCRLRVPARYGGYECDAQTITSVAAELARGDGSAAWNVNVWWIPGWMVGMFPDEVQDEVWASPDVRVCGTLSPTGAAVARPGGYLLNGRWGFISGAQHSQWQEIIAMPDDQDPVPGPIMALVPMSELEIEDDWYASGLRATGSVTTIAKDVFVPRERVLRLGLVLREQYASVRNADLPMYRVPLLGAAAGASTGTVTGLARAAIEAFLDRLPGRKITYTSYESQQEAPITHLQLGEAVLKADEAEFHSRRVCELVDGKGITGEPWDVIDRARTRADVGALCRLVKEAVDILNTASGGSSIYHTVPIQRIARDVHAVNLHGLMYPPTNYELYGRVLAGLEPNTLYL